MNEENTGIAKELTDDQVKYLKENVEEVRKRWKTSAELLDEKEEKIAEEMKNES